MSSDSLAERMNLHVPLSIIKHGEALMHPRARFESPSCCKLFLLSRRQINSNAKTSQRLSHFHQSRLLTTL